MSEDTPRTGADSDGKGTAERLWFDYLSKLNDRELQTARASGATTWLLLAVLAAITYRGLSGLNRFASTPHAIATAGTVGALLGDSLFHFLTALLGLLYYCLGKFEARLAPNLNSRARGALRSAVTLAVLAFAAAHFVLAGTEAPAVPRKTLIAFGLLWTANAAFGLLGRLRHWRRAKALGIPVVEFQGVKLPPVFGGVSMGAYGLAIGGVASVCLYRHLARLNSIGVDYAGCLSVASQFWVSAIVLFALFNRLLASHSRGIYLELERDIVLKGLSAAEIKQRFTEEALGKPVADWLTEVRAQLNSAHSRHNDILSRVSAELKEVEGIDHAYCLERQGRARKIEERYGSELREVQGKFQAISHQIHQLREVCVSMRSSPELELALDEWERDLDRIATEVGNARASLRTRLSAIYGAAAGDEGR
jgi:hypothetical protein